MKLKFLLAAFCFFNASLESAQCGKFKDLKGEEKLDYGSDKYKKYTVKAFEEYNTKAQRYNKEKIHFSDEEIEPIFSKALKWGAKYIKEQSVSEEEAIPDEFFRVVGLKFNRLRTDIALGKGEEEYSEGGTPLELKKEISKLQATCTVRNQFGPEQLKPEYEQLVKNLETLDDEIDQRRKQKPFISLLAIEELIDIIEDKNEDAIIKKLSDNIWKISYLYRTIEEISPGFFSSHLPQAE